MTGTQLTGGFAAPVTDAAAAFRAALQVMARPGRIERLAGATPPAPAGPAAGALILTLADATTPIHLAGRHDCEALRDWITFHTGAPLVARADAAFAIGDWEALLPFADYPQGSDAFPDRSATLIAELPRLAPEGARLTGPGIADAARLSLPDAAPFRANRALFPRGLDVFVTCGAACAALPRTTIVEAA